MELLSGGGAIPAASYRHEARDSDIKSYPDAAASVKVGIFCEMSGTLHVSVHHA